MFKKNCLPTTLPLLAAVAVALPASAQTFATFDLAASSGVSGTTSFNYTASGVTMTIFNPVNASGPTTFAWALGLDFFEDAGNNIDSFQFSFDQAVTLESYTLRFGGSGESYPFDLSSTSGDVSTGNPSSGGGSLNFAGSFELEANEVATWTNGAIGVAEGFAVSSITVSVPEPSSVIMGFFAAFFGICRRRRSH